MSNQLARRVAGFGTTIFTEMSALAVQHGAINLGQGFPDFPGPDFVKRAAAAAIDADLNQYAPMPGLPHLRQAVAADWQRRNGRAIDWQTEVTVTSGATEALCGAALALLDPGDRAIILEPAYDAYAPDVIMAGGEPVFVKLYPPQAGVAADTSSFQSLAPSSWGLNPDELRAAFERRPKLILINTPHNPTGKVFSRSELELIAALCQEYDVLAVADEVYDRMVYDQVEHVSLATLPGMWERTLTLNSVGKTFSVTGWKIGYAVGPAALNAALRAAHQWITFATSTPMQEATAVAIEQAATNGYYDQLHSEYDQRRLLLRDLLERAGLPTLPVQGSYFISADISGLGFADDRAFCRFLTTELGVAAIPTSVFYDDPAAAPALARFCFAKQHATLQAAGERLQRLRERI
ncbi:MAG TPA: aminotransferase class I/II-fold pyridoxal phosphate-dependent enzyme [Roseiflexaceae bacterium]|nr:aminotransferase class I/II-fold pyridoxal phosphate-dependent enzyme [Roseiflexaceae bacterium]